MSWKAKAGRCYEDAFMILIEGKFEQKNCSCFLVHGHPRLTAECYGHSTGTKYGHAWIERDSYFGEHIHTECVDVLYGDLFPKDLFYALGNISEHETVRYDKEAALEMALKTGTYGGWNESPEDSVYKEDYE